MRGGTRTRQKQQQQQEYLTEGSTVEVTSDEEGFEGVWFDGTILNYSLNKKKVLVEYRSILADDNGSKPLRELVHVSFVRPVPPLEIVECFGLHDVVDASYKDGWWTGVITKVLDDSRYQVTFNNPPDVLEFCVSDLRLHKQWVNGNWVLPGKQVLSFRIRLVSSFFVSLCFFFLTRVQQFLVFGCCGYRLLFLACIFLLSDWGIYRVIYCVLVTFFCVE